MKKNVPWGDIQDLPSLFSFCGSLEDFHLHFIDAILDAIPNPVFIKNAQGKYQYCNETFAKKIFGLPKEHILNKTVHEFPDIIPNDLVNIYHSKDMELILNPGVQKYETEVLCTDGIRHIFLFNKATITDPDDEILGMIGVMQDITDHKKREQNLVQLVEGNPIPTFVIDKNHVITQWNKGCENLTGLSAQKMIGTKNHRKTFYDSERTILADLVVDGASDAEVMKYYGDKVRTSYLEGAYEGLDFFDKFGTHGKWLFFTASPLKDTSGNIIGVVETLQDFTEETESRHKLIESEDRYRLLTDSIADGVSIVQDNRIVFANNALLDIQGYSRSKIIGTNPVDLVHEDYKPYYQDIMTSIQNGIDVDRFSAPYLRGDGEVIWLEIRYNRIDWQGRPAFLITLRDITSTKRREEFLEEESDQLRTENIKLRSTIKERYRLGNIIGKSSAMQEIYELILKTSKTDASVIITGESVSGKELVARAIHDLSDRSEMSFVPVNCGAIPDKLLESEFFGYKKGAFSGAHTDKHGYLDLSDKGSLFLDELGELETGMQVKLLRAIDKGGYYPIGSNTMKQSDFRIIAATNGNLKELLSRGAMREDFFYRLHVISIQLPPLRERKEDIPLLIDHFLTSNGNQKNITALPGKILDQMYHYHWPGNIRELQNMLHRFMTMGHIEFMKQAKPSVDAPDTSTGLPPHVKNEKLQETMGTIEKDMIVNALHQTNWNRTRASDMLGISRRALYRKMGNYELNR